MSKKKKILATCPGNVMAPCIMGLENKPMSYKDLEEPRKRPLNKYVRKGSFAYFSFRKL